MVVFTDRIENRRKSPAVGDQSAINYPILTQTKARNTRFHGNGRTECDHSTKILDLYAMISENNNFTITQNKKISTMIGEDVTSALLRQLHSAMDSC